MEKLPSLSATAFPKTTSPFNNVTVELASALPIIMGEVSFELEDREVGASGAVVSIVIEREEDLEETLPAESVVLVVREYLPSSNSEERVIEKIPFSSTVVVPKTTSPLNNVIVELASALPFIVGVGLFVKAEGVVREVGAFGVVVSIVKEREEDLEETLPAESVADALMEYVPSEIAEEGVKEKAPLLSAVVVPRVEESIKSVTLESVSALPVIVGVESLVIEEEVAKEVGASGAVVSTVKEREEDLEETLPAESVAVNLTEY